MAQYRLARVQKNGQGARSSRAAFAFGIVITVLYVVGLPWLYFGSLDFTHWLAEIRAMQLYTFGDFLADVFGPLALLWIVIAIIHQGNELSFRIADLKRAVEQQNKSAELPQRSHESE